MAEPFIGEIRMFPYNFAPRDWAYCDGQVLPYAQNPSLYAILGSNYYTGDDWSEFALPDLKGRVPVHQGRGVGLYYKWIGEMGGAETSPLTPAQMPAAQQSDKADAGGKVARTDADPHENRQPYLVLSFCIALEGLFPSRS